MGDKKAKWVTKKSQGRKKKFKKSDLQKREQARSRLKIVCVCKVNDKKSGRSFDGW